MIAIRHRQLFKFKLMNEKLSSSDTLATFQVLKSHIQLVVMVLDRCLIFLLDSTEDQYFCIDQSFLKCKKKKKVILFFPLCIFNYKSYLMLPLLTNFFYLLCVTPLVRQLPPQFYINHLYIYLLI